MDKKQQKPPMWYNIIGIVILFVIKGVLGVSGILAWSWGILSMALYVALIIFLGKILYNKFLEKKWNGFLGYLAGTVIVIVLMIAIRLLITK